VYGIVLSGVVVNNLREVQSILQCFYYLPKNRRQSSSMCPIAVLSDENNAMFSENSICHLAMGWMV
jgi:hypothetical protein